MRVLRGERAPIAQRLLQQSERADDVGLDEFTRSVDRAIDMTFCGQVHNGIRLVLFEQPAQAGASQMHCFSKA